MIEDNMDMLQVHEEEFKKMNTNQVETMLWRKNLRKNQQKITERNIR